MTELPAEIQEIRDTEHQRPNRVWPFVRHQIQFTYGEGHNEHVIADFIAEGPLPIPTEGQVIELHGVDVKVLDVIIGYEALEDGAPAVLATVRVDSADLFPASEEPTL